MTIVSGGPENNPASNPDPASMPLLEVTVLHARDADAAARGEADRLLLLTRPEDGGLSPDPATVSAVVRETDLPVRVLLREPGGPEADPTSFQRMADTAATFLELGAGGFAFGFLDRDLEIDRASCSGLAATFASAPWTFTGIDAALASDRAWRDVRGLPGLDAVAGAGSVRGLTAGLEDLLTRLRGRPELAALALASGGLDAAAVPWLVRTGVRQFGVGAEVRPDGSWTKAYVDAGAVRAWRLLLDDAWQRALGVPVVD